MPGLSGEQLVGFQRDGFLLLPGLLSDPLLDELSQEYDELFRRKQEERGRLEATWAGDWGEQQQQRASVLSIHSLQLHSAAFTRLLLHPALLDCLQDLLGGRGVVLHHTKAHLKPPRQGAAFPTHQDYHYFPFRDHSMLAVFVHLDAADPSNGGLVVFPGSHKAGPQADASQKPGVHYVKQSAWPLGAGTPVTAGRGDLLIFSYLLVHGSHPNNSDRPRRMFLAQVHAAGDEAVSEQHRSPGAGTVLRGNNPAQPADLDTRHSAV